MPGDCLWETSCRDTAAAKQTVSHPITRLIYPGVKESEVRADEILSTLLGLCPQLEENGLSQSIGKLENITLAAAPGEGERFSSVDRHCLCP